MAYRSHRMTTTDYICYNIDWETDGDKEALASLPTSMTLSVPNEIAANQDRLEEYLRDTLSDETGWLHNGFDMKKA